MNAAQLRAKLDSGLVSCQILLGRAKLLDQRSSDSAAYNDSRYLPFYYHLGAATCPSVVCQIGSRLGLVGACFLQGCKGVREWRVWDVPEEGRPASGFVEPNLRGFGAAEVHAGGWPAAWEGLADVALLTGHYGAARTAECLAFLWERLRPEGLLAADYIEDDDVGQVFRQFARVKNREAEVFRTRYGVGILTR